MKDILYYISELLLYLILLIASVLLIPFAWWLRREEGKLEATNEDNY